MAGIDVDTLLLEIRKAKSIMLIVNNDLMNPEGAYSDDTLSCAIENAIDSIVHVEDMIFG